MLPIPRSVPARLLLAAALLLPACGEDSPAPAAPGTAAPPAAVPSGPVDVEWDPEDLRSIPSEGVAAPGTGSAFLEGTVLGPDGSPVAGARVEMHASARRDMAVAPVLHATAVAGPDGVFRVGPGPSPWSTQGVLSAVAPGFARTSLVSSP